MDERLWVLESEAYNEVDGFHFMPTSYAYLTRAEARRARKERHRTSVNYYRIREYVRREGGLG